MVDIHSESSLAKLCLNNDVRNSFLNVQNGDSGANFHANDIKSENNNFVTMRLIDIPLITLACWWH